jgi:hypothetical protein
MSSRELMTLQKIITSCCVAGLLFCSFSQTTPVDYSLDGSHSSCVAAADVTDDKDCCNTITICGLFEVDGGHPGKHVDKMCHVSYPPGLTLVSRHVLLRA